MMIESQKNMHIEGAIIMSIEHEYNEIDFSRFSKVKASLFQKMLATRHTHPGRQKLEMEDLDYVTAARGIFLPEEQKNKP